MMLPRFALAKVQVTSSPGATRTLSTGVPLEQVAPVRCAGAGPADLAG